MMVSPCSAISIADWIFLESPGTFIVFNALTGQIRTVMNRMVMDPIGHFMTGTPQLLVLLCHLGKKVE